MSTTGPVAVYGATGHTGRFVVAELRRRGIAIVLSGRDEARLDKLAAELDDHNGTGGPTTVATVAAASADDPAALDAALAGAAAVINCAGPFAVTGGPLIEAALRADIPYVDVAAEIEANAATFATHAEAARRAGVAVVPAMAFYGGLGDLLATAALDGASSAEEVHVAYGLSSWHPTPGTRTAGQVSHERRAGRRVRYTAGALQYHDDAPVQQDWDFPEPLGRRPVIAEFSMADIVTVPSHVDVPEVRTSMIVQAARDLADQDTPAPLAADEQGRSDQTFVVDVRVRVAGRERRAVARGQDIYAASAPLAVEAVERLLTGRGRTTGVASAGAMFDAADFLRALSPHLSVSW